MPVYKNHLFIDTLMLICITNSFFLKPITYKIVNFNCYYLSLDFKSIAIVNFKFFTFNIFVYLST